ncbi:hypothetical protein ASG49_02395 [Marmoricola sp. Leaf446]|uniref:fatty acid desaturase family protein n=1 Tax=Marmoricola sp. Leaf446 TaxID=1736379 RepID=UPI0006F85C32|nr:acyl-CoA desaturase [Marmoricola sp. Leaf446]KQT93838.1 hypothetical protein ASG49_02395 [Marmoricola sp. Leaf446]
MTAAPTAATSPGAGYALLAKEIRGLGLLEPRRGFYAGVGAVALVLTALVVVAMVVWRDSWWLLLGAPVLAVLSTQYGFLGHDIGHRQVTRGRVATRVLGIGVGNGLAGLSYGWWVAKHNAHHAHPNDLATDPDVAVGALVWDADQAEERRGGFVGWVTRHQAALFVPMLLGEAFALHVSSVRELFRPGLRDRWAEATLLVAHLAAYVLLLVTTLTWAQAIVFGLVHKMLQGLYLGLSFAPGHKGMPTLGPVEAADPLLRQVLTSRNIRGGRFVDAALGGLNYQIEHHLFPSMPRSNLRHAQPVVRRFCAERGVPYAEAGAGTAYAAGLKHLHAVGSRLRERVAA